MFTSLLLSKTSCTNDIIKINSTKTFLKIKPPKIKRTNISLHTYCSSFASCRTETTKVYISTTKCFSIIINFIEIYFTLFLYEKNKMISIDKLSKKSTFLKICFFKLDSCQSGGFFQENIMFTEYLCNDS
jgi:hypothetical protein